MDLTTAMDSRSAAAVLEVSPRTVTRMAIDGRLPAVKLPGYLGRYLFDPADVAAYKEASK